MGRFLAAIFLGAAFFTAGRFIALFAGPFLATIFFLAAVFFGAAFLAGPFFIAAFFAATFFTAAFFATAFFTATFFATAFLVIVFVATGALFAGGAAFFIGGAGGFGAMLVSTTFTGAGVGAFFFAGRFFGVDGDAPAGTSGPAAGASGVPVPDPAGDEAGIVGFTSREALG